MLEQSIDGFAAGAETWIKRVEARQRGKWWWEPGWLQEEPHLHQPATAISIIRSPSLQLGSVLRIRIAQA